MSHYCPSCMLLFNAAGHCPYCKVPIIERKPTPPPRKVKVRHHEVPHRLWYGRPRRKMTPPEELRAALDRLYTSMGY